MKYTKYFLNIAYVFSKKKSYIYNIDKNVNDIIQISGNYSIFNYDKGRDIYRYGSKERKKIKYFYHSRGTIEDHHIIPKQFKEHKLLRIINFDIACSNNLLIMPSLTLKNDKNIIYHCSHRLYNDYILHNMNQINKYSEDDEKKYHFWLFFCMVKEMLEKNDSYMYTLFDIV